MKQILYAQAHVDVILPKLIQFGLLGSKRMLSKKSVFFGKRRRKKFTLGFSKSYQRRLNGYSISFWHSTWSPFGPLIQHIGSLRPRRSGIPLSSNLSALWNGNSWIVSQARTLQMEQVHIHISHLSPYRTPLIAQQVVVISKIYDSQSGNQDLRFCGIKQCVFL